MSILTRFGSFVKKVKTAILYGTWLTGSAVIGAGSLYWATNEIEVNADVNKNLQDTNIYNLEELVRKYARGMYRLKQNQVRSYFRKQSEPSLTFDWSGVEFIAHDTKVPEEKEKEKKKNEISIECETTFENKSNKEQQHTLRTEAHSSLVFETILTKGCIKNSKVGLSIPIPKEVADFGVLLSTEMSVNHSNKKIEDRKQLWVVEDVIKVPKKSKLVLKKKITEMEIEYDFRSEMDIKGNVIVKFMDKNQKRMVNYPIPIEHIISAYIPDMKNNGSKKIKIEGKCKCTYEQNQTITTSIEKM